jgi:Cof subfamily protein (haloacid dehalogenase superfamily)
MGRAVDRSSESIMIRLAAFDLDGTLMGADQSVAPRVQQAIAEAQRRDVVVTLATGRMFAATRAFAEDLGITAPLICYQGGWVQSVADDEPQHRIPLSKKITQNALALAQDRGWHTVLYADGHVYLWEKLYNPSFYERLLGADITVGVPWMEVLAEHVPDKVLFVAEPEAIPEMAQILKRHFEDNAEIVQSHAKFVEVVPLGANKGAALAWLASHLEIPQAAVMAVGDQENDLAMVAWAGVGVAMGNATPQVQSAADWVAPPLSEDGAAMAIERFILHN